MRLFDRLLCLSIGAAVIAAGVSGCAPGASAKAQRTGGGKGITFPAVALDPAVANLRGSDKQPLLLLDGAEFVLPPAPADPKALPEDDPLHWYDMEYSGWDSVKQNLPKSPGDGPRGKTVLCLRFVDHPYLTAYSKGMQQMADYYGIKLDPKSASGDPNLQREQVDQAINSPKHPDLVIISPVDATQVVPLLRKLNKAGIPVIASNIIPAKEGMPYVLAWTGPNDWGQFRMLAREFAKKLGNEGGYCIVRHFPGGSPYFSRTFAAKTELAKIAPKMQCLDMQTSNLESPKTQELVSSWLTTYGSKLKGIISADDSAAMSGIAAALKQAGRKDVVVVAAGNSKVGMQFVQSGELYAITYQSAEADGALPMYLAAQWFSGKPIERPVYYLPQKIITKQNVGSFLPPQW